RIPVPLLIPSGWLDKVQGSCIAVMPKLLYSTETHGCGATIKLDNQETCMVSCARSSVLVKSYQGRFGQFWINFFGAVLYNEKVLYKAAQTSMALDILFPENRLPTTFSDPVLNAFANAIWQCSTGGEISRVLNEAIMDAEKQHAKQKNSPEMA
ncbi:MAG: hypothetical protein ABR955_08695, partial [Verrucomicrobiota bacterium]